MHEPQDSFVERSGGRTVRHVISVGGGRGGVGKSLLTVNIGVYLAQLGREVLVVDTDMSGSSLHIQLGLDRAPLASRDAVEELTVEPVTTSVPGLRVLPSPYDPGASSPFRPGRKARWLGRLKTLPADYVLLHLGPGNSPGTLDLFLASEVGLCVTVPDPAAVESTYRFLRSLFLRRLRRALTKDRFKLRIVERAMQSLEALPSPLQVVDAIARHDKNLAEVAALEMRRLRACLVVNQTRLRTDIELGSTMQNMALRYLGVSVDYLGHIDQDDQAWLTARRRRPLLVDSPTAKSARNLERIVRRVAAMATSIEPRVIDQRPVLDQRVTLYDVLGVPRGASEEDVRRAYKRQREHYAVGNLPLVSLLDDEQVRAEAARVQEAYDTILDPVRRRAYDLSTFPEVEQEDVVELSPVEESQEQLLLQAELARELHPEAEYSGELLRKVRESLGVGLEDISSSTRIAVGHLFAIEEERYDELPAQVYVRGFVQQLARYLKLDPSQVSKTYLRRMNDVLVMRGQH